MIFEIVQVSKDQVSAYNASNMYVLSLFYIRRAPAGAWIIIS